MAKREFVQLAHKYVPRKCSLGGWMLSEKLDGQRAVYDGGITRGMRVADVPWANVEKDKKDFTATGLWSRGGKAIFAPGWFLDLLPNYMIDGELYAGRGNFQLTESIVRDHVPGPEWDKVKLMAFDSPPVEVIFADGTIETPRFTKRVKGVIQWIERTARPLHRTPDIAFQSRYKILKSIIGDGNKAIEVHNQIQLDFSTPMAERQLEDYMNAYLELGGEGVVVKNPGKLWRPERSYDILKYKPWDDAEATVTGYTWGAETDKGSKLLGMMGAIWLVNEKGRFKCSGFTNQERQMAYLGGGSAYQEGRLHPEEDVAENIHNPRFPRGTTITYKYRELTDAGIPKEARYHRVRKET